MLGPKRVKTGHRIIYFDYGEGFWLALQLLPYRRLMVLIEMHIAKSVHELSDLAPKNLCNNMREQSVARDVERNSKKDIRTSLIELKRDFLMFYIHLIHVVAYRKVVGLFGFGHRV